MTPSNRSNTPSAPIKALLTLLLIAAFAASVPQVPAQRSGEVEMTVESPEAAAETADPAAGATGDSAEQPAADAGGDIEMTVGGTAATPADPFVDDPTIMVGEITFEGLFSWQPVELLRRLSTRVGQPYNALLLREDVSRLAELMRRVEVRIEPMEDGRLRVAFLFQEFARLRKMQVIGNDKISTERVEKVANLTPGDILDERVVKSLRQALVTEYRGMGLSRADVTVSQVPVFPAGMDKTPPGQFAQADLQIIVDEGDKVIVDDIIFEGNEVFSDFRLRLLIDTKGSWGFVKNYFDEGIFETDLIKIKSYYDNNGYLDSVVERGIFEMTAKGDKKRLSPVIRIREGEPYQLGEIDVRGARLFSREEVLTPFRELVGEEFDAARIDRAVTALRELYLNSGFLTTEIGLDYDFNPDTRMADLIVDVHEKNRIYVGKIRLDRPVYKLDEDAGRLRRMYERLAPPVSDEAIVREILLRPGEVYSKEREKRSVRQLESLGVFQQYQDRPGVEIVNEPTSNPRVHNVLVKVEEGTTGGFGGGVGFGDQQGGFIFFWLNERNLFGEARDLRINASLGFEASSFSATYLDRHYEGTDDAFAASAYYNRFRRQGYIETHVGGYVERSRPLIAEWVGALRARLEHVTLEERAGIDADEELDTSYPVGTVRLAFSQDTRSPRKLPTEGRRLAAGIEVGYADGPLVKFTGEAEYNTPFRLGGRDVVYRFRPSVGLMPIDSKNVGLTERFFLGGNEDMRGFDYRGAGRRDKDEEEVGIGGSAKLLIRNELIFPIFEPVYGVYFIDFGMLGESPFSYEVPKLSTGVGTRINLPQATVAIDFALPLLRDGDDQTRFIHFSFSSGI